jgi:hypothetical protein
MIASIEAPAFAAKGSQRWLQIAVNRKPSILDTPLRSSARLSPGVGIEWRSPLASEAFVEYSDSLTFDRLGVKLEKRSLKDFWPPSGPHWDGLARATTGDVFLVEAKGHIGEMVSGSCRASGASLAKIAQSLGEVQREIAPKSEVIDWTRTFYQYANRLAHLHLLRMQNDVDAHLVLVYFLSARREWAIAAGRIRGCDKGHRALPWYSPVEAKPICAQAVRRRARSTHRRLTSRCR